VPQMLPGDYYERFHYAEYAAGREPPVGWGGRADRPFLYTQCTKPTGFCLETCVRFCDASGIVDRRVRSNPFLLGGLTGLGLRRRWSFDRISVTRRFGFTSHPLRKKRNLFFLMAPRFLRRWAACRPPVKATPRPTCGCSGTRSGRTRSPAGGWS